MSNVQVERVALGRNLESSSGIAGGKRRPWRTGAGDRCCEGICKSSLPAASVFSVKKQARSAAARIRE